MEFQLTGIAGFGRTVDGEFVVLDFKTAQGEPVKLSAPVSALAEVINTLLHIAKPDPTLPTGDLVTFKATGTETGLVEGGSLVLVTMLHQSGVRFPFVMDQATCSALLLGLQDSLAEAQQESDAPRH